MNDDDDPLQLIVVRMRQLTTYVRFKFLPKTQVLSVSSFRRKFLPATKEFSFFLEITSKKLHFLCVNDE